LFVIQILLWLHVSVYAQLIVLCNIASVHICYELIIKFIITFCNLIYNPNYFFIKIPYTLINIIFILMLIKLMNILIRVILWLLSFVGPWGVSFSVLKSKLPIKLHYLSNNCYHVPVIDVFLITNECKCTYQLKFFI
jgi:hypothetical protein